MTVEIADAQGRMVPTADNQVTFRLSGPGAIIGVGNGDPSSHEPDKANSRRAFNGLCMAIVQAAKTPGEIWLEATSPGLQGRLGRHQNESRKAARGGDLEPLVIGWIKCLLVMARDCGPPR